MEEYKVQNQNAGKPEDKKRCFDTFRSKLKIFFHVFIIMVLTIKNITTESYHTLLFMETCSLK